MPKYKSSRRPGEPRDELGISSSDSDEEWITPVHSPARDHTTDDERRLAEEWGWDYSDDEDPKPGWEAESAHERRSILRGNGFLFTPPSSDDDNRPNLLDGEEDVEDEEDLPPQP